MLKSEHTVCMSRDLRFRFRVVGKVALMITFLLVMIVPAGKGLSLPRISSRDGVATTCRGTSLQIAQEDSQAGVSGFPRVSGARLWAVESAVWGIGFKAFELQIELGRFLAPSSLHSQARLLCKRQAPPEYRTNQGRSADRSPNRNPVDIDRDILSLPTWPYPVRCFCYFCCVSC